eukprot:scaffold492_cov257-Pinguiococcus_pyrenoidosus.AAC.46
MGRNTVSSQAIPKAMRTNPCKSTRSTGPSRGPSTASPIQFLMKGLYRNCIMLQYVPQQPASSLAESRTRYRHCRARSARLKTDTAELEAQVVEPAFHAMRQCVMYFSLVGKLAVGWQQSFGRPGN